MGVSAPHPVEEYLMKAVRELRAIALVIIAASTVACGSDSSVAPDHPPADLTAVLSEMALPSIVGSLVPGAPATPDASALSPSSCSYDSTSQSFTCPVVTTSGITLTRSFTLLSLSGTPQSQFDPATTAAVRTNSTIAGTITADGSTVTLDGQDELTLSGILTGVHVLNGTSVMNLQGTDAGSTTPFAMSISTTIADLVLPATSADRWPKSGRILVDLTDSMDGTTHMTMTFNGTSKVTVTMTSDGFTLSCTMDLASQSPTCG
jgi:hypothetical protein